MDIIVPGLILAALGLVFGLILAFASKKFAIAKDERVEQVRECLPGANCGACGYAGCDALADAIVKGDADATKCTVNSQEGVNKIAAIMGVEAGAAEEKIAVVQCQGNVGGVKKRYEYFGVKDCQSAADVAGGPLECRFACLGFGNCERACPFDAISMVDGIAKINAKLCTGCGTCVAACPRGVIALIPKTAPAYVACRNTDPGKVVRSICSRGCIACGICEKKSEEEGAIKVDGGICKIDYSVVKNMDAAIENCPTKVLVKL